MSNIFPDLLSKSFDNVILYILYMILESGRPLVTRGDEGSITKLSVLPKLTIGSYTSHKKVFRMKTSTCRDRTLKNLIHGTACSSYVKATNQNRLTYQT